MLYKLNEFQEKLGYAFHNLDLLREALTHPSYAAEQKEPLPHNQRLEFLGDAVLQLVITGLIYQAFPQWQEGMLSKIRAALTNQKALSRHAHALDIGCYLRLGHGEDASGGRDRESNLADAFEALLGAIYLDGGLQFIRQMLEDMNAPALAEPESVLETENPKGALQELTQQRFQAAPEYEILNVSGPEHLPEFEVRVMVCGRQLAQATAGNRKSAEKQAAAQALHQLMVEMEVKDDNRRQL